MLPTVLHVAFHFMPIGSLISFLAMLVAAGTIFILWRYRKSAEVTYLLLIEICAAVWALFGGLEFWAASFEKKVLWSELSYFGFAFLPVCYFLFTAAFSQKFHLINSRNVYLMSIIPFLTILFILTNEYHHMVWKYVTPGNPGNNTLMITHGIWFWVFWSYAITLIIAGLYNLFLSIYEFTVYYKTQVATLLIATLIPLAGNLVYITGINPIPGFDWTPVMFVFTGLVITFGILRYRMFDLVPFARNNLIDTMSDGVIIVNSEGFIEDYNPAIERIFTLQVPVIRNRFSEIFSFYENINTELQKEEHSLVEIDYGKQGRLKNYQVRISPIYNRSGQFSGHLLLFNDITSLKASENKLRLVNKKLEAEVEERGRLIEDLDSFAHTVAHDLRNSLGSVQNAAEILEECIEEGKTELVKEFSGHIKTSSEKAVHITHELLLLATVNHHDVEQSILDMKGIFARAKHQLRSLIEKSEAQINVQDHFPDALGYGPWIEEVFVNYLSNAIKYGGSPPLVKAGAISGDHFVRFWIRDNGNGIALPDQNKLFKKYSRLNPEKAEGYGLGLSIVKRIIRKSGGYVGVESTGKAGEGACFWFELPAVQLTDSDFQMAAEKENNKRTGNA